MKALKLRASKRERDFHSHVGAARALERVLHDFERNPAESAIGWLRRMIADMNAAIDKECIK